MKNKNIFKTFYRETDYGKERTHDINILNSETMMIWVIIYGRWGYFEEEKFWYKGKESKEVIEFLKSHQLLRKHLNELLEELK